ncbi:hypothetical protein CTI12_AA124160 [Artemisia annua]|uniref:Uncharacterized protein n=1 Tax=Artemisia annua TaxID=35608 RepID=A0A2U1PR91_ARTAN|nr:hypothetical protein CTI12_AA124160 [Artemisia annua]
MNLQSLDQMEMDDIKQNCRVKWAVEEDENSIFFHSLLRNKFANSSIKGISISGVWSEIRLKFDHFASRFKERSVSRPKFVSNLFRILSDIDASYLESNFSMEEGKTIGAALIQNLEAHDGLDFSFTKPYMDLINNEFYSCIKY